MHDWLDAERALNAGKSPSEKLAEALEMMEFGVAVKRTSLRLQNPQASDEELERMIRAWLESDG